MSFAEDWNRYLYALAFVTAGVGFGILLENIVLKKLIQSSSRPKTRTEGVFLRSFRGIPITWMILAGIYSGLAHLGLNAKTSFVLNKILEGVAVISVSILLSRILVGWIRIKSKAAHNYPSSSIVANIVRIGMYIVAFLVILQGFGISVTPLLTALGVGALAVALALQDTLTNLFSGLQVIASRQVRIGDYIKLDSGEEGYVSDITWRNTMVRALSNNYILVPNSKIASAIVTNYYLPEKEMAVLVELGVSFDSDLDRVEEVTIDTARRIMQHATGGVADFEPFIRYHTLGDSAIRFTVILRGKEFTDQYLVKHEFIKAVIEAYREYNIEVPFPTQTLLLQNKSPHE